MHVIESIRVTREETGAEIEYTVEWSKNKGKYVGRITHRKVGGEKEELYLPQSVEMENQQLCLSEVLDQITLLEEKQRSKNPCFTLGIWTKAPWPES